MKPNQYTKLYITSATEEFEYSDGIINIETIRGSDKNTGIWSIPDVGQATIVTRNPNLDPHVNANVRYGNKIRIIGSEDGYEVFNGFINDINVEYNPFGGDTFVTIHAIDAIGLLQKHYFTEEFCDYLRAQNGPAVLGGGVTITDLAYYMNGYQEIPNFIMFDWGGYEQASPTNTLAKYAIKPGDNAWDVITQLCQSSLLQISSIQNILTVMPYYKHNTYIEDPMYFAPPQFFFASDGNPEGYKSITLDDGFDRTTNQVYLNNNSCQWFGASDFTEISANYGPYNEQTSIAEWGTTNLELTTLIQDAVSITTTMDALSYDILEDGSQPEIDITSITFDGTKSPNTGVINAFYPFYSWTGAAVNIKHTINDSIQIDKNYSIIGVANSIDYSNHLVTLYLRPSIEYLVEQQMTEIPTITMNALTGDTNFNFSATISNFNLANIDRVEWTYEDLSGLGVNSWETQSTSLTPTWNYDPSVSPEYWQGPGPKTVRLRLYSITGWMYTAYVELNVTAAVPTADFTFTESYGTVTFLDTSFDADTWLWDFGDGNTSTEQNPVHHYESNNTFNVQLQISNGVLTDSITKPVTIDLSKIECNYVKFEWSGTATVTGGVPDKYWLEKVVYIDLPITPGYAPTNLDNYANVDKVVTAGNVYKSDGTTVWAAGQNTWDAGGAVTVNADQILTDKSTYTTNVWVKPQVSASTQTYGSSLIIKPRQMLDLSKLYEGTDGAKIRVENLLNARLWFLKNSWVTGRTYQPINIYVSADGTNWNQIGSTGTVIGPAQIPSGTTGAAVLNLDATVPMPPYYP